MESPQGAEHMVALVKCIVGNNALVHTMAGILRSRQPINDKLVVVSLGEQGIGGL